MKTYCKQCGEATEYTSRVPILCAYCGQSFGSAGQLTALTSQPKPAPALASPQTSIPNQRRFAASNRRFKDRHVDNDDDDQHENEEIEVEEIINSLDMNRASDDFIISTDKASRTPIKDIGSSPNAVRDPETSQVRKAGRPKKTSAKEILAEFQKEAGTLRKK